jgi:rhomboid protease GluP
MSKVIQTHLSQKPRAGALTITVIGILSLTLVSLVYWLAPDKVSDLLDGRRALIYGHGEFWRLWTAIGAHGDPHHLLSNLPLFAVLSFLLYGYFGAWGFPLVPALLGGVVNALTLAAYPRNSSLVGASGVVYLMAGLWLGLFMLIERRQSLSFRIAAAAGFVLVLLMPETFDPKTSYLAHGIGFGAGLVAAPVLYAFQRPQLLAAEVRREPVVLPPEQEHEHLYGAEPYYWLPRAERPEVSGVDPPADSADGPCAGCA